MSVVANVVCRHGSWVVFDGRAARDGEIVSESQEKATMINQFVCVGYTGTLELAQLVILNLKQHVVGISDMKSNTVATAIEQLLPKLDAPDGVHADFLITGINCNGQMATYTIGSNHPLCKYIPAGNDLKLAVLCSNANTLSLSPYIEREISKSGFSNVAIVNGMRKFVCAVAKVDGSVNTNCQVIELRT